MFEIDRSLMVVKPTQHFLDWAQSVDYDEGLTLEHVREDSSAYLIPQFWENSEQAVIRQVIWMFFDVVDERARIKGH
jgi:hypothetical protein